jgi:hypothetical protein
MRCAPQDDGVDRKLHLPACFHSICNIRTGQGTTSTHGDQADDCDMAKGEEVCVLRVQFPDDCVSAACRNFGAGHPTAVLYMY